MIFQELPSYKDKMLTFASNPHPVIDAHLHPCMEILPGSCSRAQFQAFIAPSHSKVSLELILTLDLNIKLYNACSMYVVLSMHAVARICSTRSISDKYMQDNDSSPNS